MRWESLKAPKIRYFWRSESYTNKNTCVGLELPIDIIVLQMTSQEIFGTRKNPQGKLCNLKEPPLRKRHYLVRNLENIFWSGCVAPAVFNHPELVPIKSTLAQKGRQPRVNPDQAW